MSVLGAGFFGPTEGEKKRRRQGGETHTTWKPMCGDRVVTPVGWTGEVVAQHGHYSWVLMEATNSPQTWGTSTLKPVENPDA